MTTLNIAPAKDTKLFVYAPTTNYGSAEDVVVIDGGTYGMRSILEFSLSSLPAGAVISSATLKLYYYYHAAANPVGKEISAFKLTRTDWVELQATWNIYKTGNNWTAAGGDFVTSDPSGGTDLVPAGYGWMEWDIQDIVEDAQGNSDPVEILMKFTTEPGVSYQVSWYSKEYGTAEYRPKLTIEYTLPSKTTTYTADALFKALGLTETLDADTLLKKLAILETVDADALIKKLGITTTFLAKAIFGAANITEVTADALFKALGLTQTLDVDALLQQQDITQDITADTIINLIATQSVDADAILKAIKTATFTVDVRLGEAGAVAFTASVCFKRLAYHVILDAQYITETPEVNRAYVIGRDAEGNPVHGTDLEQAEIDLVGERLDFQQHLSIPTSALAADVADAMLKKQRLSKHRGFILIPPNAGAELWDVIQVTDKLCAQSGSKYRVLAITFDYHPRHHRYEHKLFLGAR